MSAADFQRALCDLVASPRLCLALRAHPADVLNRYELTSREARRLTAIVFQRGMSMSCTLYRMNRITPLCTLLPLTNALLGDQIFLNEAERFWEATAGTDLQFKKEVEAFAAFLHSRVEQGHLAGSYVVEVLDFELALARLQFVNRESAERQSTMGGLGLHPLVVVVRFTHDPAEILPCLAAGRLPPIDLPESEQYVLIDGREESANVVALERSLGRFVYDSAKGHGSLTTMGTGFASHLQRWMSVPAGSAT